MSQYYEMQLRVAGLQEPEPHKIQMALEDEWDWGDFYSRPDTDGSMYLHTSGQDRLCGGESADQFARRCYKAVLKAIGRPVKIEITSIYLDDLPYETHDLGVDEAEKMLKEIAS